MGAASGRLIFWRTAGERESARLHDVSHGDTPSRLLAQEESVAQAALRAQLRHAESSDAVEQAAIATHAGIVARMLNVPLRWKLLGANAILIAGAALVWVLEQRAAAAVLGATLVVSILVNQYLVRLALAPLKQLETTASRVVHGDIDARVAQSPIADRDIARIGTALNMLLDSLVADRERMRLLAAQVISAQDQERARVARELHDSTAQTLAAAMMQIATLGRERSCSATAEQVDELRALVAGALEEVRTLSHVMHPRVLDDLGLSAALTWLARQARQDGVLEIDVDADPAERLSRSASSALYRVAQESIRNVLQHAEATHVDVTLRVSPTAATLSISDDGAGFDVADAERRRPGMGLFSIRERVTLVNGTVEFLSAPSGATRGTTVIAKVPLST
jgi:signal transduction histidine kinase